MPIHESKITLPEGLRLAMWRLEETPQQLLQMADFLPDEELQHFQTLKSERRKSEWLATRLLLKSMLPQYEPIQYNPDGKPYLVHSPMGISISHTSGMVAVLLHVADSVAAVDIEKITPRIERISHKFLLPEEIAAIPGQQKLKHMYIHWCAKEAMYKAYNIPNYDYLNSYALDFFAADSTLHKGRVIDGDVVRHFSVMSFVDDEYVMCVATLLNN